MTTNNTRPIAWVRFCTDGGIEGPLLDSDSRMCDVRRNSGAWTPLYQHAALAAVPDESVLRAALVRIANMQDRDGNLIEMHRDELRGIAKTALAAPATPKSEPAAVPEFKRFRDYEITSWYEATGYCPFDGEEPYAAISLFNAIETAVLARYLTSAISPALAVQMPSAVPDGWQLVPIEPTPDMMDAHDKLLMRGVPRGYNLIYAAMLAAAPAPVAQQRPQNCGTTYCSCISCPFEPAAVPDEWKRTIERAAVNLELFNARPRPLCRDCADSNGICSDGHDCDVPTLTKSLRAMLAAAPEAQLRTADVSLADEGKTAAWLDMARQNAALLAELENAHQIIRNALAIMTTEQKCQWADKNNASQVDGEGATRANERMALIESVKGGGL
ncbi:hypothetical protein [Chitinimonas sp.]|uniref:hypothetical protein n=1 Tax=Chitinimonas sp. TaxID=1934313 RepID=UPI0035AFD677